ncbi:MAG TPA: ankyrin repeat domain-containing protein [Planctomycetaceae bacterium]|jgi:ankyrin repeat protein|nr:ankyrin repeat domain-containing protein [Planctomycetaceae bacterium]
MSNGVGRLERLSNQVGWTLLHVVAETYESGKLEAMIRAGADINARAANGQTSLHMAAAHGSYGGIRILLQFKANPNLKDNAGRTPVQLALGYDPVAVDDLLAGGAEIPDILVAAVAGRADLVKRFLEKDKAAVNARVAGTGDTALHLAALHGRPRWQRCCSLTGPIQTQRIWAARHRRTLPCNDTTSRSFACLLSRRVSAAVPQVVCAPIFAVANQVLHASVRHTPMRC